MATKVAPQSAPPAKSESESNLAWYTRTDADYSAQEWARVVNVALAAFYVVTCGGVVGNITRQRQPKAVRKHLARMPNVGYIPCPDCVCRGTFVEPIVCACPWKFTGQWLVTVGAHLLDALNGREPFPWEWRGMIEPSKIVGTP